MDSGTKIGHTFSRHAHERYSRTQPLNLLIEARQQFTQRVLAQKLSVTPRIISHWENRQTQIPLFVEPALREILQSGPERPEGPASFTFVDLFAGIGGMRSGFESAGGRCVFTSEWNQWAQKTYRENFGIEDIAGDITKIPGDEIPDHDVLLAGFPCHPSENLLIDDRGNTFLTLGPPGLGEIGNSRLNLVALEDHIVVVLKELGIRREPSWSLERSARIPRQKISYRWLGASLFDIGRKSDLQFWRDGE